MNKKHLGILAVAATATVLLGLGAVNAQTTGIISPDAAAKAALTVADGILIDNELDYDKRQLVYDVEILDKEGYRNKIDINAFTGAVEREYREQVRPEKVAILNTVKISHSEATQIALAKLDGATVIHSELETKGSKAAYEIDLVDAKGLEHDAVVDAVSGELLSLRQDEVIRNMPTITKAQAEESAKTAVNGTVLYTTLDNDRNGSTYEVMLVSGDRLFEVEVDGSTGKVLKTDEER